MVSCSAYGCKNRSEHGFLMRKFPKDLGRRKRWIEKVQRKYWTPTHHSYLCEVHFEPHMWEKTREDGTRKLKYNAVPTVFKQSQHKEKPFKEIKHVIVKCEVSCDNLVPSHTNPKLSLSGDLRKLKCSNFPIVSMNSEQENKSPMEIEHVVVKCEVSYDDPLLCDLEPSAVSAILPEQNFQETLDVRKVKKEEQIN